MPGPLAKNLSNSALAFRGFNQRNLGRTPELLQVPAYQSIVRSRLSEASEICSRATGQSVDLLQRVQTRQEATVDNFSEAIALVFAAELAQVQLAQEVHGINLTNAARAFGYSLGELTALTFAGAFPLEPVLRIPLALAADCAELAANCTMVLVFSRKTAISEAAISALCEEITSEGQGAIAISSVLSPNTLLVLGEGGTTRTLRQRLKQWDGPPISVRENEGRWPPIHTPLVSQRHVPDRAALMIRETPRLAEKPAVPIWSMVTGRQEYEVDSGRRVLKAWIDSPQRLWDVIEETLASEVRQVIHIGPKPNVIPATFERLAENVVRQTLAYSLTGVGLRTVRTMVGTPWLAPLLPRSGCLLRAPMIEHVILEDWLLENAPA